MEFLKGFGHEKDYPIVGKVVDKPYVPYNESYFIVIFTEKRSYACGFLFFYLFIVLVGPGLKTKFHFSTKSQVLICNLPKIRCEHLLNCSKRFIILLHNKVITWGFIQPEIQHYKTH